MISGLGSPKRPASDQSLKARIKKGGYKTEMAKLQQLIKGFRANVREGNPCALTFTGTRIHLHPLDDKADYADKTYVGICDRSNRKPAGFMEREKNAVHLMSAEVNDLPDTLTYGNTGISRPEF